MPGLVALDVAQGPGLTERLEAVWSRGDAACVLDQRVPPPTRAAHLEVLSPTSIVGDDGEEVALPHGRAVEEGDALVVLTSGSTSAPRAVVLTHDAVAASARATSSRLGVDPARDRWLCCLPCAHVGGLSVVTRSLLTSTPLEVLEGFDPIEVAAAAARGATLVSLVPAALAQLGDPRSFRRILLGGAAPPRARPHNAVVTWGMTETGSGVVYDGAPLDGVEVASSKGQLFVRAPMLARAYRDGTALTCAGPDGRGGWFATGDAGVVRDGVVEVFGRLDDAINTGGEKVWPQDVERALATHPSVREVGVWKRDDERFGERVVAFVVAGADVPTLGELRDHVKATLPAWAAPRELVVVDALPLLASGKVDRRRLVELSPRG